MKSFIAKKDGTDLFEHCFKVGEKCREMAKYLSDDERIIKSAYICGVFHDLGKCVSYFQSYLRGENSKNEEKTKHNIISSYYCGQLLKDFGEENCNIFNNVLKAILYHHSVGTIDFNKVITDTENEKDTIKSCFGVLFSRIKKEYPEMECYENFTPKTYDFKYFSEYDIDQSLNDEFLLLSSILVNADIVVSSGKEYDYEIRNDEIIINKPISYDERFDIQKQKAEELNEFGLSVFTSQTGFGKTMLGLMYLLSNKRKCYWVCPQNSICKGVFNTIKKELNVLGLNNIKVSLLLAGEYEGNDDKADIIVTNIDNFVSPIFKSNLLSLSFDLSFSNVIFDEFHEYVCDSPIMNVFTLILEMRSKTKNTKTLLLSATPISLFYKHLRNFDVNNVKQNNSYNCEKILNKKIKLCFVGEEKDIKKDYRGESTMIFCQSVKLCQKACIEKKCDNLIHSRFTESGKKNKLDSLLNEHGKGKGIKTSYSCTNVISTGIDISFENLVISSPTPESLLQSLGRCNRWDEYDGIPLIEIINTKPNKSEMTIIRNVYDKTLVQKFYDFLKREFDGLECVTTTLGTLYHLREKFYTENAEEYKNYFLKKLNESRRCSAKYLNYEHKIKYHDNTDDTTYISKLPTIRNNEKTVNDQNFYARFKNKKGKYIDEVIQTSSQTLSMELYDLYDPHEMLSDIYSNEEIKDTYLHFGLKNNFNKYYSFNDRKLSKEFEGKLMRCSKTPLLITQKEKVYYDNFFGIIKN